MITYYSIKNLLVLAILISLQSLVLAGTTGKISGRVLDEITLVPLPGVNIGIVGTTMGASTDADGYYTILNVSPGTYTVKVSMIGYSDHLIEGVKVNIDQTAKVNVLMKEEVISLGNIVVVAEKKIVKEDVSASITAISNEEIEELPVVSLTEAVGYQAGVEEGLVIRGGEANEALFLVDGLAMRDARNNKPVTSIALSGVSAVSLERGGFNAEYGQVRSGVLNIVTKDGDKESYDLSFTVRMSPYSNKFYDESPFDENSMWLRPYLDPEVAFVGTENGSWDQYTQNQYPRFDGWNEISERLMSNSNPDDDLTPEGAKRLFEWQHRKRIADNPDYNIDAGFGGPVPLVGKMLGDMTFFMTFRTTKEMLLIPLTRDDYQDYDYSLKLSSHLTQGMKLHVTGLTGKSYNIANNGDEQVILRGTSGQLGLGDATAYLRSPSDIVTNISNKNHGSLAARIYGTGFYSEAVVSHFGLSSKLTHVFSPTTFYDLSVDYFQRSYETGPKRNRDFSNTNLIAGGFFTDEAPFGWSSESSVSGIGDDMVLGAFTSTSRDSTKTSSISVKFDLTSQVDRRNQVKTGFEFVYNSLDFNFGTVNLEFPESNTFIKEKYNPLRAAFYIQDKLEFEGFVANIGVRFDYSDQNTEWADVTPFDKAFFGAGFDNNTAEYDKTDSDASLTISPRLGISHPITEYSKLFFNYGHFKQLPGYEHLFQNSRGASQQITLLGDPNLSVAKTISYELGYDHAIGEDYLFQLAGFYHDVSDQIAVTRYQSAVSGIIYSGINSNSYEDTRGFEATLRKSRGDWFKGFFTYTYQVNTRGRFGKDRIYEDPSLQSEFDKNIGNFAQDRPIPQPWANLILTFFTNSDYGPEFIGINPFGGWALTVIADWRSGWWATRNPLNSGVSQNVQAKDWYNLNLRLTKEFDFDFLSLSLLIDASNVLNTRRLSFAFADFQDSEAYWNSLHLPKSNAYNNIVGDDRYGEFRNPSVEFHPIEQVGDITSITNPSERPFYYESSSGKYMQYSDGNWSEVSNSKLDKVLEDKAYIDMPNQTSFNFLNPRRIFFGLRASIKF